MIIRNFVQGDEPTFLKLCEQLYSQDAIMATFDREIAEKTFKRVMDNHENLWGLMIIDKDMNIFIGYALLTSYWCNEEGGNVIVLDELFIAPSERHKGYASMLMKWIEEAYKDIAVAITLEVLTSNEKARELYTKAGYQPDGYVTYTKTLKKVR